MRPKLRFRDLPGISVLESEAMIADKFHQMLEHDRVDEMSRATFGTTESDISYDPPQWFCDGFESQEDWDQAPKLGVCKLGPYFGTDYYDEFEEGSPRERIFHEMDDFDYQLCGGRELNDDYDRMHFAATLGIDFSDHTGEHPLHLTRYFFRQAVAATLGLKGHMPDLAELSVKDWGARLEEERKRFESARRSLGRPQAPISGVPRSTSHRR